MKYPHNTSQCNKSQLQALLALGKPEKNAVQNPRLIDTGEVLRAMAGEGTNAGEQWRTALASETELDTLSRIKTSAKLLHQRLTKPEERESATMLYHIALAAALARKGVSISNRPIAEQVHAFEQLIERCGDPEAEALFHAAIARWKPE